MFDPRDSLLMEIFQCGYVDLSILDGVRYAPADVLCYCYGASLTDFSLNDYMLAVFKVGIDDIQVAINDRLCELEAIENERDRDEEEEREYRALEGITPDVDIYTYCNCIDTHVYFSDNAEVYRAYLSDALEAFADNTGFEIGG